MLNKLIPWMYPHATSEQIRIKSVNGVQQIDYFDPELGEKPTDAEIANAWAEYKEPSILLGGVREPAPDELNSNKQAGMLYFIDKTQQHINDVAAQFNFGKAKRAKNGELKFYGDINNIAKYTHLPGINGDLARALSAWNDSVWLTLRTLQQRWYNDEIVEPSWNYVLSELPALPRNLQ